MLPDAMKGRKVDFLIIGAQKAGTTSLYRYLEQHPEIYFSEVKEVNYFAIDRLYEKGTGYYHSYFKGYSGQKIVGSAYTHLLPCRKCAERVKHYNPEMKLLVLLREPVARAWSAYHYAIRNGWEESGNFRDTVALEAGRLDAERYDLTYFYDGLYSSHLDHWSRYIPQEQMLLLRQADLESDPEGVMSSAFSFLGLDPVAVDATSRHNVASGVHSRGLQRIMLGKHGRRVLSGFIPQGIKVFIRSKIFPAVYRLNKRSNFETPQISPDDRKAVEPLFREDLARLKSAYGITFES